MHFRLSFVTSPNVIGDFANNRDEMGTDDETLLTNNTYW